MSNPAPVYVIRDAGIVVDLARGPVSAAHPQTHAINLLQNLSRDEDFSGQPATEKALKKYYAVLCRSDSAKPFPWLSVVRHLNLILKMTHGAAYKKTYKNVYEGGRLRKRRVYAIPTLGEFEAAMERVAEAVAMVA